MLLLQIVKVMFKKESIQNKLWRMPSCGMLRRVPLVWTDVLVKHRASIIRVTRIGDLETIAVTSNRRTLRKNAVTANVVPSSTVLITLMMETLRSSET
jgi:hypothetical protein